MRYLTNFIQRDLNKKMVLLAGPRQCGKTTLAKSLLHKSDVYLNWDITKDRKIIRDTSWPKNVSTLVLDEIHKAPKWRNYLKGLADEFNNKPRILVTGSARLETFRRSGDALTGRHYYYRLHPIDVSEASLFSKNLSSRQRVERLLDTGGFPESYLNPKEAARLRIDRLELVLKEDLKDLSKITSWRGPADLIELLRERVGRPVNFDSLARDVGVTPPTSKAWVELLEKLYTVFLLSPYSGYSARSIRKEKRVYFFDCGAAYDDSGGSQLENLVACSLYKFINFKRDTAGENWDLFYLRDKEKREIDFVVTHNRKPHWLIEVKKSDDNLGQGMKYYSSRFRGAKAIQLVLNLERPLEKNGVSIVPLDPWLDELFL